MDQISEEALRLAKDLWAYHHVDESTPPSSVIIAMGCDDVRVAERAIELFKIDYGEWLICTGHSNRRSEPILARVGKPTEAAYFASTAAQMGVDPARIFVEDRATNPSEHVANIQELLASRHIVAENVLTVVPSYSERYQQAAYATYWPQQSVTVTSPKLTFETYATSELTTQQLIIDLVTRTQLLVSLSKQAQDSPISVPRRMEQVCERLATLGFTAQQ